MAKIRVQAGSDRESSLPSGAQPQPQGALGILRAVAKEQGPLGWYQVRLHIDFFHLC